MTRLATLCALLFFASPATAQVQCGLYQPIVDALSEQYGEVKIFEGLSNRGSLVEVYGNHETGTWTALVAGAGGQACITTTGRSFNALALIPVPKGEQL